MRCGSFRGERANFLRVFHRFAGFGSPRLLRCKTRRLSVMFTPSEGEPFTGLSSVCGFWVSFRFAGANRKDEVRLFGAKLGREYSIDVVRRGVSAVQVRV